MCSNMLTLTFCCLCIPPVCLGSFLTSDVAETKQRIP